MPAHFNTRQNLAQSMNLPISAHTRLSLSRLRPAVIGGLMLSALTAHAASDTWVGTAGGNWSNTANWASTNAYANGTDAVATVSAAGTQTVNLDTAVTLGTLAFSTGTYTLSSSNGSVLTLATTTGTPSISGTATISAALDGSQGFTYASGSRTLTLSGNNIYTGVTTLTNGNLTVRSDSALGATGAGNGTVVSQASGQFPQLHILNNITTSEDITLRVNFFNTANTGAIVGGNLIYNDSGTNTLNGNLVIDRYAATNSGAVHLAGLQVSAGTLTINGTVSGAATNGQASGVFADPTRLQFRNTTATANTYVNGAISNGTLTTGGLSIYTTTDSLGIVRFSGANTYSGSTVHQKGTLLINNTTGSGTGTGSVSVASTAVFGGTGIIKPVGTTTVNGVTTANGINFASGSIVAPGDLTSAGAAIVAGKTLTFDLGSTTGTALFSSGSTISINLNAAAALPADVSEHLSFIGLTSGLSQVTFNSNVVNFSITGGLLADGVYTLASFSADNAYTGQWVLGTGLESYATAQLIQNANSIQLSIGAIPEPANFAALAGLAGIGWVIVSRRRRS
jgi:autotransporter-associated beta strand protein